MTPDASSRAGRRLLKNFALGLPAGALIGFLLARFDLIEWIESWRAENVAALVLAAMLAFTALVIAWATTSEKRMRRLAGPRDPAEPLDAGVISSARSQAGLLLVAAAGGITSVAAAELGWAITLRQAAMAAIVLLTLFCAWQSWRVYRLGDELMRAAIVSSAAVAYFVGSTFVFVWACAVKLGLLPEIGSWTIVLVLTCVSLVCSTVVQLRRGLVPD